MAFFTVIAFSFVAAGVGHVCVGERVRKVRHQQILAGVTPLQYWLSSYLVDLILLLLPCSLIFGMLVWADISPLVCREKDQLINQNRCFSFHQSEASKSLKLADINLIAALLTCLYSVIVRLVPISELHSFSA